LKAKHVPLVRKGAGRAGGIDAVEGPDDHNDPSHPTYFVASVGEKGSRDTIELWDDHCRIRADQQLAVVKDVPGGVGDALSANGGGDASTPRPHQRREALFGRELILVETHLPPAAESVCKNAAAQTVPRDVPDDRTRRFCEIA
jgi:hypothetical protein